MSDYFYCNYCCECQHKDEFPLCYLCEEYITPPKDSIIKTCNCGYICDQHVSLTYYKNYDFTLCCDCSDLLRDKDKDTLKNLNEKIEEKEEDSD